MAEKFPTTQENGKYVTVDELSDDTDDTRSTISEADFNEQNVIYISGLPLNMSDQQLISALYDTFSGCGLIKVITMKYFLNQVKNRMISYIALSTNDQTIYLSSSKQI